eukprot:m.83339 g.83339  ORF g.83339 m.83339 type:complete len:122 (+) comp12721_c0_seq2:265-630(+)
MSTLLELRWTASDLQRKAYIRRDVEKPHMHWMDLSRRAVVVLGLDKAVVLPSAVKAYFEGMGYKLDGVHYRWKGQVFKAYGSGVLLQVQTVADTNALLGRKDLVSRCGRILILFLFSFVLA